jgi:hypothetical protein
METIVFGLGTAMYKGILVRAVEGLYDTIHTKVESHPLINEVLEEVIFLMPCFWSNLPFFAAGY